MSRVNAPQQTSLDDDLNMLTDTLEEVLRSSGNMGDDGYQLVKARAENTLKAVRDRLNGKMDCSIERAKDAVCRTNEYVREKPWHGVGIGATVGLIVGLLLTCR
ncbi:DUF883 family protein [Yersinia ruckeri]|uniref:DUF883 family protein n=1 Tax=Yersinia ruckeri TaxID=29486 RepID=UPI0008FDBC3A|nr:DUF883 family protein [Yersinia ruckeri]OJB95079.1 hypothetical protein AXW58_05535 [Yersinia ruckeri]OJC01141.1 hypothetical protein AXW59_05550 [Yersinia ruckeri]OJC06309.1 hypothetical protein AXW57_05540 [Yersinia ruckeri]